MKRKRKKVTEEKGQIEAIQLFSLHELWDHLVHRQKCFFLFTLFRFCIGRTCLRRLISRETLKVLMIVINTSSFQVNELILDGKNSLLETATRQLLSSVSRAMGPRHSFTTRWVSYLSLCHSRQWIASVPVALPRCHKPQRILLTLRYAICKHRRQSHPRRELSLPRANRFQLK